MYFTKIFTGIIQVFYKIQVFYNTNTGILQNFYLIYKIQVFYKMQIFDLQNTGTIDIAQSRWYGHNISANRLFSGKWVQTITKGTIFIHY